ncbi:histone acetyltransferase NDAI_0C03690 [Naumovozyma dairenensis CBS 421]|uniref:Transcription initiation factor TFIID subunit 1 histone acetyltransferase domain-containing protein n=1 Tax=Naumovozyma dairenensis (strain ATCC 10597 / BCRC 20456 / CBS 421 / NBRC 0211 / NRRL Y-12639) TaxID=1071378 RepID=G0W8B8_NAUDC|nr:hypothetical protein NDAI_0C03690 [Naumovozyma dairenensis CBS 421]CCD24029.1 hypothetical protein NDAI_0C03690 [Naumovozyma dairenensis CBS 421]
MSTSTPPNGNKKSTKNKSKESKTSDLTNEEDAYNAIFGGDFGSLEIGSLIAKEENGDGATEHLPDAMDFEDEEELAEEEEEEGGEGEGEGEDSSSGSEEETTSEEEEEEDEGEEQEEEQKKGSIPLSLPTTSPNAIPSNDPFTRDLNDDNLILDHNFLNALPTNLNDTNNPMGPEDDNDFQYMDDNNALFNLGVDNTIPNSSIITSNNNVNNNNNTTIFMDHNPSFDDTFSLNNTQSSQQMQQQPPPLQQQQQPNGLPMLMLGQQLKQHTHMSNMISKEDSIKREREKIANEEKFLLKTYFPTFKKGKILKWNKFIYRSKGRYNWHRDYSLANKQLSVLFPINLKLKVQTDQRKLFMSSSSNPWQYSLMSSTNIRKKNGIISVTLDEIDPQPIKREKIIRESYNIPEDLLIATDDWDQEKIINGDDANGKGALLSEESTGIPSSLKNILEQNDEDWNWNEENLINVNLKQAKTAELNMNDENLLLIRNESRTSMINDTKLLPPLNERSILTKIYISNDNEYDILKRTHQPKVRSTISNLNIEHSLPALKLQSPYYKVSIPKSQVRYFHRPHFGNNIRPGTNIVFSKLKIRKRKRDKGKDIKESFASTQDLTIGDTAPIYLMEYSEQTPLALSKFGMANKLINYYRKTSDQDTLRPKLPVGETHVLGVQDKSPFWNFGFVEPGHIVPTLYNNMIRAPVFKHDVSGTDFLLVRSSGHGVSNRFYIRGINHLFAVGQTFPVEEIPGPNSRKVTSMKTTRLRMIVYRLLNKAQGRSISIDPVNKHFPDQDYGQNRQKVKEFMKYQRDGPDKGLWKLKEGETLLDNEHTRKLITPEQVSEVETTSQGIQFQEDNEWFNFDDKLKRLEENLLPWNATKNFINATQMRAMIQIHGAGDPTGVGEGFSFLKTSMKGGFIRSGSHMDGKRSGGHTYNVAEQQKAYEGEISKTWYTHAKSLSVTNPFEEIDDPDIVNPTNKHVKTHRDDNKVLKIVRKRRDANGIIQRQTIIVRDPRVIQGYLKGKEKKKAENLDVNKLLEQETTNIGNMEDIEMQKKLLQNELANLEKSQQRRTARQNSKKKTLQDGKVTKNKNTTRRCATCGQVGHIKTNKACPMYNSGVNDDASTPSAT